MTTDATDRVDPLDGLGELVRLLMVAHGRYMLDKSVENDVELDEARDAVLLRVREAKEERQLLYARIAELKRGGFATEQDRPALEAVRDFLCHEHCGIDAGDGAGPLHHNMCDELSNVIDQLEREKATLGARYAAKAKCVGELKRVRPCVRVEKTGLGKSAVMLGEATLQMCGNADDAWFAASKWAHSTGLPLAERGGE